MTTPNAPAVSLPWRVIDDYRCFGCSPEAGRLDRALTEAVFHPTHENPGVQP